MRAITVSGYGASPAVTELPRPQPGPGQVLTALAVTNIGGCSWLQDRPLHVRRRACLQWLVRWITPTSDNPLSASCTARAASKKPNIFSVTSIRPGSRWLLT
jgi:hypothetical protein